MRCLTLPYPFPSRTSIQQQVTAGDKPYHLFAHNHFDRVFVRPKQPGAPARVMLAQKSRPPDLPPQQPLKPHEHWHTDISYINICGTFYYLWSVLDGFSRPIVHWEICESMREADVEIVLQRVRERFPDAEPRIISDNGPQFIFKDFREFIRLSGMTHVRTAPFYPRSNGKQERWHTTLQRACISEDNGQTWDIENTPRENCGSHSSVCDAVRIAEKAGAIGLLLAHCREHQVNATAGYVKTLKKPFSIHVAWPGLELEL